MTSKDVQARLLFDSIRQADSGNVEYTVETKDGLRVPGVIESSFFEEFKVSNQKMTSSRKERIAQDNADYIEEIAKRQIRIGLPSVTIK